MHVHVYVHVHVHVLVLVLVLVLVVLLVHDCCYGCYYYCHCCCIWMMFGVDLVNLMLLLWAYSEFCSFPLGTRSCEVDGVRIFNDANLYNRK